MLVATSATVLTVLTMPKKFTRTLPRNRREFLKSLGDAEKLRQALRYKMGKGKDGRDKCDVIKSSSEAERRCVTRVNNEVTLIKERQLTG